MKLKNTITLSLASLILLTTSAFAAPEAPKIAVVDIQKVVASSAQVKALKSTQDARNKELTDFIKKAQADVNKQTDDKNKKALASKYEKPYNIQNWRRCRFVCYACKCSTDS